MRIAGAFTLCVLLAFGAGAVFGAFAFQSGPSEEYRASQTELAVVRALAEDSLRVVRAHAAAAHERAEGLVAAFDSMDAELASVRAEADFHEARADSLHGIVRSGHADAGMLRAEIAELRAALDARDRECLLCAEDLALRDSSIVELRTEADNRITEIRLLTRERDAALAAVDVARAEVARAPRRIGTHWVLPKITVGLGCVTGGCGLGIMAGFSVNPWRWIR